VSSFSSRRPAIESDVFHFDTDSALCPLLAAGATFCDENA
jgi:hypothetical protein